MTFSFSLELLATLATLVYLLKLISPAAWAADTSNAGTAASQGGASQEGFFSQFSGTLENLWRRESNGLSPLELLTPQSVAVGKKSLAAQCPKGMGSKWTPSRLRS